MTKAATVHIIKKELKHCSEEQLIELCLRLSKFKTENKELLSYLLFEASDEEAYIKDVKTSISEQFKGLNTKTYYFMRKGIRKILRDTKKFIRYSQKKQTAVELLMHFCIELKNVKPSIERNGALEKIFETTIRSIEKNLSALHEDLQYDYLKELDNLLND